MAEYNGHSDWGERKGLLSMNERWSKLGLGMPLLSVVFFGCVTQSDEMDTRQADIGLGIVEGTKGYQQIQSDRKGLRYEIKGQVVRIEGAAYVVRMLNDHQTRLPFDENTQIDRPAHLGDWIEAQFDQAGRARIIRNIDDQIVLE